MANVPRTLSVPAQAARPVVARRRWHMTSDRMWSLIVISPSIILVAIFVYYFIARTAYVSLVSWNDLAPDYTFRGLFNYERLFQSDRFLTDLHNTGVFTVVFISVCLTLGLLLAVLLDRRIRGEGFFRATYMFPLAVSFIVTGVVWRWLESPKSGLNLLFDAVGLGFLKSGWFTDPNIGILAIVLPAVWQMSGYVMALYLAGLRGISDDLREAARVDGGSEWQVFRHVLFPLLHPVTLSAVIILGQITLRIFDLVITMTGAGPGFVTDVPALFMYETTFLGSHFSQGASIAIVMLLLVSCLVIPYLVYNTRNEVHR
jgi:glucose/mannose transport system permease protein